jgi:ribosome biogenesis GTPase / thiamine phosphate phosphatase
VDRVVICTSVNRDWNPSRLERYCVAVRESGIPPTLVLTKADLSQDVPARVAEVNSLCRGTEVFVTSLADPESIASLRCALSQGTTSVLIGSSGVGKSSLVNAILGRTVQWTQGLGDDDSGRHTTAERRLIVIPGGGVVIDTPGLRELGLLDSGDGVDAVFDDLVALASQCRYRDCQHGEEPGCAVRQAIADGSLEERRLSSWNKLQREAAYMERRINPEAARQEKQRWKKIHKAGTAAARQKRCW